MLTTKEINVTLYCVNIIFTKHAKIRMIQREISEEEVKSLVKSPNNISGGFKERAIARRESPKGILEVIYKKSGDKTIIITCYWRTGG